MDGDRPRKAQWDLCDRSLRLTAFFDRPLCVVSDDLRSISKLDDRKSLMSSCDMPDRAIRIARFEVIFHEHDSCSYLQDKGLWCETSFFEGFDEWK